MMRSRLRPGPFLVLAALALAPVTCAAGPAGRSHAPAPQRPRAARLLALGDGYTACAGLPAGERWTGRLAARMRRRGLRVDDVRVLAGGGWTTADVVHALDGAELAGPYALVLVQAGAGDHFHAERLDDARARFSVLLARAVDLAGHDPGRVVVLSLPDWTRTPFARERGLAGAGRDLDAWNDALRERVRLVGARWVDVTTAGRSRAEEPGAYAADSLHYAPLVQEAWAAAIDDTLAAAPPFASRPRAQH